MLKTTVYLDPSEYGRLKAISRRRGVKPATLIREAIAEYTRAQQEVSRPRTLGNVDFDVSDLSERVDDYLVGMGLDAPDDGGGK